MNLELKYQMTADLITIGKNEPLEKAYRLMAAEKIRHLAVTNEFGEIYGIISDRDVQRGMVSKVTDVFGMRLEDLKFQPDSLVADYTTWPPKTISSESTLRDAVDMIMEERISSLLVVDGRQVIGILTTDDLLRLLRALLEPNSNKIKQFFSKDFFGRVAQLASDSGL